MAEGDGKGNDTMQWLEKWQWTAEGQQQQSAMAMS